MGNLKSYLGDGVYADVEDGMVKLTTENGYGDTNTIFMKPEVIEAFKQWLIQPRPVNPPQTQEDAERCDTDDIPF